MRLCFDTIFQYDILPTITLFGTVHPIEINVFHKRAWAINWSSRSSSTHSVSEIALSGANVFIVCKHASSAHQLNRSSSICIFLYSIRIPLNCHTEKDARCCVRHTRIRTGIPARVCTVVERSASLLQSSFVGPLYNTIIILFVRRSRVPIVKSACRSPHSLKTYRLDANNIQ